MISLKQLAEDAKKIGLKVEVAAGKVRVEGQLGDVKKAFAAQGCDLVKEPCKNVKSYAVYFGKDHLPETFVGSILSIENNYAYGFTCSI